MDRDEILAKSRKENQNRDLVDLEAANWANAIAIYAGTFACALLNLVHAFVQGGFDYGVWTIYLAIGAAIFWGKFSKRRKGRDLALGLLYLALCLASFALYLYAVSEGGFEWMKT